MNKFFRLVSMFAIAGATFAYTSCTDYSEDINKANDRIDKVEGDVDGIDGRLKTVEGQVSSLNTAVDGLKDAQTKAEASITELQTALKALQDKHAEDIAKLEKDYAAADAALKSEIQSKIDALTKTHADDVKALTNSIDALKTDVKNLQDKAAEVEKVLPTLAKQAELDDIKNNIIPTLATKDSLEAVSNRLAKLSKSVTDQITGINTTIGTLQGNLEVAQKNITALENRMTTAEGNITALQTAVKNAQKAAEDAQTAADKAQEDANTALGEIKSLKDALKSYATTAALNAVVEQLEKMDSTVKADKFNADDFAQGLKDVLGVYAEKTVLANAIDTLQSKDAELLRQITQLGLDIEEVEKDLESQISNVSKDLDEVEKDLNDQISGLDAKVDSLKKDLNDRIDSVLGIIAGRLSSIAFVPAYYYDGVPAILFETIAYNPLEDEKEDVEAMAPIVGKQNSIGANKFSNFTTAIAKAQYRLNPRTVGVDCADFSFVGDKADYVVTRATAPAAPISIVGAPEYDATTGYVTFSVKKEDKLNVSDNTNKNLDIVALKAVLKKGLTEAEIAAKNKGMESPEVYSEYAHVNEIAYSAGNLAISDSLNLATKSIKRAESINGHEYAKTFTAATKQDPVYDMPYNQVFDLRELIATCINTKIFTAGLEETQDHIELDLAKYDLEYRFSVAQTPYNVKSEETTTNQQFVIECTDAEKGLYKVISTDNAEFNKEAIGRTPIVRVDLIHKDNGNIVTRAFIKLRITVNKKNYPVNVSYKNLNLVYECPETEVTMSYDEEDLRKELYRVLDIDHVSFWNIYEPYKAYVTKGGKASTITKPELLEGVDENGKATKKVVWNFTHGEVGKIGTNGSKVEGYLVVKNKIDASSEYPTEITFKFTVNFRLPTIDEIDPKIEINDIFWKDGVLQANANRPESTTDVAENCWFKTPIADQPWIELSAKNLPCNEVPTFRIASVYKNDVKTDFPDAKDGIYLTDNDGTSELSIALDKNNESIKAAMNSEKGLRAIVEWYAEGMSGDTYVLYTFTVNFIPPVNLNLPENLPVKDAVDGGDEITFGYEGLLTDWRGNVILPPTEMEVLKDGYCWNKVCSPADHAVLEPAYTKVIKEGYYEVEFQDVEVVIPAGAPYYEASIQLSVDEAYKTWYDNGKPWGKKPAKHNWKETEVVYGYGRTAGEAKEAARAKVNLLDVHYLDGLKECGRWAVELPVKEITSGSEFSFKVISKVTYHEAVTEEVEAKLIYSECNPQPGPSSDVYTVGQRIGCWEWQKYVYTDKETNPGQYWDFYGKFGDIVLDLERDSDGNYKNVKTDLVGGKLPSGASLVQTGYKLKYENVQSPIQYSYHISIPASIQYGWGTLTGELRITVKPADTINPENTIK